MLTTRPLLYCTQKCAIYQKAMPRDKGQGWSATTVKSKEGTRIPVCALGLTLKQCIRLPRESTNLYKYKGLEMRRV